MAVKEGIHPAFRDIEANPRIKPIPNYNPVGPRRISGPPDIITDAPESDASYMKRAAKNYIEKSTPPAPYLERLLKKDKDNFD